MVHINRILSPRIGTCRAAICANVNIRRNVRELFMVIVLAPMCSSNSNNIRTRRVSFSSFVIFCKLIRFRTYQRHIRQCRERVIPIVICNVLLILFIHNLYLVAFRNKIYVAVKNIPARAIIPFVTLRDRFRATALSTSNVSRSAPRSAACRFKCLLIMRVRVRNDDVDLRVFFR